MAKERTIPDDLGEPAEVVDREHLDGGTFGIQMMDFDAAAEYGEVVTRTELERDPKTGQILYNQKSGAPSRRYVSTTADEVAFAAKLVAYVKDLRDQNDRPLPTWLRGEEKDAKKILALLKLPGLSQFELDSEGNEFIGAPGQTKATEIPYQRDREGKPTDKPLQGAVKLGDGRVVVQFEEPTYKWVLRESARMRREKNEVLRKNFSPTQ
jgi:hypothetical protein